MIKNFRYVTNCVNSTASAIDNMVSQERDVKWATIRKHCNLDDLKKLFAMYDWNGKGLHLKDDWAVSFHKSKFKGMSCYFIQHSAIEYVFVRR